MFFGRRFFFVTVFFAAIFSPITSFAAIPFSGNTSSDFPARACMNDPGGQDVGMPAAFPATEISGFDIQSVCFSYDPTNDTLYIGAQTFVDASGVPIIFGDADGAGDPAGASLTLQNLLGDDLGNLSGQEFFTFVIDFNADSAPDLVVGTHNANSLLQFADAAGVAAPNNNLLLAPFSLFYGAPLAGVTASLSHLPTADKPHLEFSIADFSSSPNYAALDFNNPDSFFQLYITTGSFADDGISEEYYPNIALLQKMNVEYLIDSDLDTINNALDLDDDNDTIPDLLEKDLDDFDTNSDGALSAGEVAASGLDGDGDGDIDTNDGLAWTDTDGDGTPDYLDLDSDADGLSDLTEAGNPPAKDSDGDGVYDFRDTDSDNDGLLDQNENTTDPTKFDTDGDGLCDGLLVLASCTGSEILRGTDPLQVDTDGDGLCDGAIVVSPCYNSEGNLGTNPLFADVIASLSTLSTISTAASAGLPLGGDVDLNLGAIRLQGAGCSLIPGIPGAQNFGMFFWSIFLMIWLGIIPRVWAFSADHYRTSQDGLGFFNHESVLVLPVKEFSLGVSNHLIHRPLNFGLSANGRNLDNVVSFFYVWDFWGAIGVYENVDVGINFPISLFSQVENLDSSVERNTTSIGDLRLQAKWQFLEPLALQAFLDLPTGESSDFFGEGDLSGGLKILGEHHLGQHEIGGHVGMLAREKKTIVASGISLLNLGPEMLWGLAWRYRFRTHQWEALTHLWGKTDLDGEGTSPIEWDFGFNKGLHSVPVKINFGIGFGMNKGYGSPTYRLIAGIQYVSKEPTKKWENKLKEKPAEQKPQVRLEGKEIVVLRSIHFDVNRATIEEDSFSILDEVAMLLEKNRTILKIRIDGHTDSDASDNFNLSLSYARAQAVKNYLVEWGIEPSRLTVKGWGESQPVIANNSSEAKAKNRRVEFHVIEAQR